MDLISVIVPIYNVSEYLCECIDSILAQTYRNLEIILVDDGSTDNSPALCDNYASKDSRVKVIHQINQGASVTRNKGYEASRGKYIAFIDADDVISDTYIEILHKMITENNVQIAVCAYTRVQKELGSEIDAEDYVITSEKMLKEWHGKRKAIETIVWNKLYSRSIFESFKDCKPFPEGKAYEDIYTSHLFANNAEKIAVTNRVLYYYRRRKGSASGTCTKTDAMRDLEAQKVRMSFFKERKFYGAYLRLLVGHLLHRGMYFGKLWNRW